MIGCFNVDPLVLGADYSSPLLLTRTSASLNAISSMLVVTIAAFVVAYVMLCLDAISFYFFQLHLT